MAIKGLALIEERDRRKKKKEKELVQLKSPEKKETTTVKKTVNNKGTTYVDRSTISKKPTTQNTTQNRVVTNKDRLSSNSTFGGINTDIRTVKTQNKPKQVYTADIYERDGNYYYKDGKKEKQIDRAFVEDAIKNKRTGVIGRYDSKGTLRTTDEKGNVKEQSLLNKAGYLGRTAKTRAKKGTIAIADAALQEAQNDLQKGEKLKTTGDKIAKFASAILNSNPEQGMRTAISKAMANSREIWKDKDKNALQKYVGTVLEGSQAISTGSTQGLKDITELAGSLDKNLDEKVAKAQQKLDAPVNKELEQLEQEKYNYGKGMRRAADIVGTTANMAPGIATSIITRNPELGILPMAVSAKGQTTERALQQGADLDTAVKMGSASGLVEAGTEQLSGLGLGIFGKGTLDDVVSNTINSKIRNKGINFLAKQGFGLTGEVGEEVISDLAGLMIDKGTIDPNAKYTFEDFLETAKNTFGSTVLTNLLTGGYGGGAYRNNIADMQDFQSKQLQQAEVIEQVNNGAIDKSEANQKFEQIENGTYEQNKNLDQIATQQRDAIVQAVQTGQLSQAEATQEMEALNNTLTSERERINTPQEINTNENNLQVKQAENKSDLKEVVDEDLYNVDIKDVENQIYRENYKLNEDIDDENGPVGNYWDIDDTYFNLKDGNTLWIETPTEYGKLKNGKTNYNDEIHNKINIFIEDANGNIVEEKTLKNDKGEFTREDIINEIKSLTYDDSNKQAEGQIDMFGNVHVGKKSNNVEKVETKPKNVKLNKQKLMDDFKKLTGDTKLQADAKIGRYQVQLLQKEAGNFDGEVEAPYSNEAMELYNQIENSKKTSSHLYHSTPADRIQSIVENGLQIGSKQNQEGVSSKDKLYLSATEELAQSFAPNDEITLRIKPSAKLENLDNDLLGGEGSYTITNNIEPKYLQVKENGKWIDLTKSKYAKVDNNVETNQNENIPATKSENVITIKNDNLMDIPKDQIKGENTGVSIDGKEVQMEIPIDSKPNKLGQYVPKDGFTKKELKSGKLGDSKFYKNVTERADFINDEVRERIKNDDHIEHYRKVTNEESMQEAFNDLNTRGTEAIADFFNNDKELTSKDTAMGWLLIAQSQENGDYDFSNQVLRKMRSNATKIGQAEQMYNYYARLTPEGMYRWCGDQLLRAEEIFEQGKTKKWIEANKKRWQLNGEEVEFIKSQMQRVQELNQMNDNDTTTIDVKGKTKEVTVDRAKQVEIAKIQAMIENKIPPEKGKAINAWMRISMLGNLKTIGTRNPLGNIALRPVNDVGDFAASLVDYAISKKTGVRTKGNVNIKAQAKGMKKGASETVQDFRLGINTRNAKGNRFEIGEGKSFNDQNKIKALNVLAKGGNKADSGVSFLLDLGDRPFYEANYQQSLENQMRLNGIEKIEDVPDWMKNIAETEGLERTYQDDNNYTKSVIAIRNAMNMFNVKGYGFGDVIIPFAKTPANLTKAIVDYSPAGFVNAITKGKQLRISIDNGQFTPEMQHAFVNQLGKATAGTILYAVGAALANSGLITGGSDEDKDVADFMKNTLGIQPYSIKIGNKSYTYDWAQPLASGLAIPADIKKTLEDAKEGEVDLEYIIHKSFSTAGSVLLEQSFLQGIKDVLGGYGDPIDNLLSEIEGLPARAIPTLFQQIVTYLDGTKRMSYGNKGIQNMKAQAQAKTPWAKDLPVYRNSLGKEVKMYGGKNNFFNVFINPANYSEGQVTESAEEIYKIYKATNKKDILPRLVSNDLKNEDGTKLTNKQKSDFLKISGDIIDDNVKELKNNYDYRNMSDEDKAEAIKGIVEYAYNKARNEITGHELSSEYKKTDNAVESGYALADYYATQKYLKSITPKKEKTTPTRNRYEELMEKGIDGVTFDKFKNYATNTRGESKTGGLSKNQKIKNYIQKLPLTAKQKAALWEDYKENQRFFTYYN